jgi:hypothetical protein
MLFASGTAVAHGGSAGFSNRCPPVSKARQIQLCNFRSMYMKKTLASLIALSFAMMIGAAVAAEAPVVKKEEVKKEHTKKITKKKTHAVKKEAKNEEGKKKEEGMKEEGKK